MSMNKDRAFEYSLDAVKTALANPACQYLILNSDTAEGIAEFIKTLTNELSRSDE